MLHTRLSVILDDLCSGRKVVEVGDTGVESVSVHARSKKESEIRCIL
jgi:hypothetical protein